MLLCKAYVSSAVVAQDKNSIHELLTEARRNNERVGVTGLLCVFDSNFLQFLEGDDIAVDTVFARIQKDRRHRHLIQLETATITERLFPDWSMALMPEDMLETADLRVCRDLRSATLAGGVNSDHRRTVEILLDAFRRGIR